MPKAIKIILPLYVTIVETNRKFDQLTDIFNNLDIIKNEKLDSLFTNLSKFSLPRGYDLSSLKSFKRNWERIKYDIEELISKNSNFERSPRITCEEHFYGVLTRFISNYGKKLRQIPYDEINATLNEYLEEHSRNQRRVYDLIEKTKEFNQKSTQINEKINEVLGFFAKPPVRPTNPFQTFDRSYSDLVQAGDHFGEVWNELHSQFETLTTYLKDEMDKKDRAAQKIDNYY